MKKTPATDAFFAAFKSAVGLDHDEYVAISFGDSPDVRMHWPTWWSPASSAPRRRCSVTTMSRTPCPAPATSPLDGRGRPCCIWRTTRVDIRPLIEVDETFAWHEGEGDRSRASLLDNHRRYFSRQAASEGFAMHDRIETVLERFEFVWPPEIADRRLDSRWIPLL